MPRMEHSTHPVGVSKLEVRLAPSRVSNSRSLPVNATPIN